MLLPPIIVALDRQTLYHHDGAAWRALPVSTAKNGAGERINSFCTPRGLMVIRAKIGAGADPLMVFRRRRPSGECCTAVAYAANPTRDWILGRILWLSGLEPHINRRGAVDTLRRFIYIHGTPPSTNMQVPGSMGCVRMLPQDLLPFFDQVPAGSKLLIVDTLTAPWVVLQPAPAEAQRYTISAYPPPSTLMANPQPTQTPLTPCASQTIWQDESGAWHQGEVQKHNEAADEAVMAGMREKTKQGIDNYEL